MASIPDEDILDLPIRSITDGWVVKDAGQRESLYLFVQRPDGATQTILIPRATQGSKPRSPR